MKVTAPKKATPLRNETAEAAETVRFLKRSRGRTGSADLLSTSMKATNSTPTPRNVAASSTEYQGNVEPPLRNPKLRRPTHPVRRTIPSQSMTDFTPTFLDSLSPNKIRTTEAIPRG